MLWTPRHAGRLSTAQTELIHTIRRCGLTSGLKLCLDAGDANSYASGQSWLDTSGNGYDFFRGATSGSEASDPTFNGTAGQRASTNYWSFDGGDFFRYDTTNETWMNNLHKDNAIFAVVAWLYAVAVTAGQEGTIFGTPDHAVDEGAKLYLDENEIPTLAVWSPSGNALTATSGSAVGLNAWHFIAVSLDEAVGANGGLLVVDGVTTTFTSTYTTPSSGAAAYTMEIGAGGNGTATGILPSGSRIGMFAAWEGVALTQTQLNALYMSTRGRFGV